FLPNRLPRFRAGDRPAGIGTWELVDLLGMGGFGEVWLARHPRFGSIGKVALKFCVSPDARKALEHEAALLDRVVAQCRHPGIVALRQAHLDADPPCLEYEYVAGGDLAGIFRQWQGLPQAQRNKQATAVVRKLAEVVGTAHRLDPPIVHRDLKPANV